MKDKIYITEFVKCIANKDYRSAELALEKAVNAKMQARIRKASNPSNKAI